MSDLKFSQEYVVYRAKKEGVYPIKETDWSRIKRLVIGIIPNKSLFLLLSSASFGVDRQHKVDISVTKQSYT